MEHRSRLSMTAPLYGAVRRLCADLRGADLDLWADGLAACLHGADSHERLWHIGLELRRLRSMSMVRRAGLERPIAQAATMVEAALGPLDTPHEPLYAAVRDLADHLSLHGGGRWLARLRVVGADDRFSATERLRRLDELLDKMTPGTAGLPEGTAVRVRAARQRLARVHDHRGAARCVELAVRPPAAEELLVTPSDGDGAARVRLVHGPAPD